MACGLVSLPQRCCLQLSSARLIVLLVPAGTGWALLGLFSPLRVADTNRHQGSCIKVSGSLVHSCVHTLGGTQPQQDINSNNGTRSIAYQPQITVAHAQFTLEKKPIHIHLDGTIHCGLPL